MIYKTSDKLLAYLTLISGLVISAVAIWYSVAGLVSIFAASAVSIIVMGVVLEVSKLVATVWLKWNWKRAPLQIKVYLLSAIVILMLITSMGIFGYLSRAHLDQAIPSGDIQSQVALIDEKINNERETIANARTLLGQLDKAVADISATPDREVNGRVVSSAERALQVRRQQARDRENLTKTIEASQSRIVKLQEEKAPVAKDLRAIEAEVGPIKYIAKLIYGDNPDQNILDKAVTWVIIIIVLVFDPLAVILLLASQYSFQWFRQQDEERKDELVQETTTPEDAGKETSTAQQSDDGTIDEGSAREQSEDTAVEERSPSDAANEAEFIEVKRDLPPFPEPEDTGYVHGPWPFPVEEKEQTVDLDEVNAELSELGNEIDVDRIIEEIEESKREEEKSALDEWNRMIEEAERAAEKEKEKEKELLAKPDFTEDEAAEEAAKWAMEQIENSKKKDSDMDGKRRQSASEEIQRDIASSYVQNAEQNESTIWQRVKNIK